MKITADGLYALEGKQLQLHVSKLEKCRFYFAKRCDGNTAGDITSLVSPLQIDKSVPRRVKSGDEIGIEAPSVFGACRFVTLGGESAPPSRFRSRTLDPESEADDLPGGPPTLTAKPAGRRDEGAWAGNSGQRTVLWRLFLSSR